MKNNKLVKVVIAVIMVAVVGGLATLFLGKYDLVSAKVGIKDKSIEKKTDEFAGIFVTYGTEKVNPSQRILNKEKKVYGKIDLDANRVYFGELEGEEYVEYKVEGKELTYNTTFMGEGLDIGNIHYTEGENDRAKVKLSSSIYFNPDIDKDVISYVNPVYKDSQGKLYVTSQNNEKVECSRYQYEMDLKHYGEGTFYHPVYMDSDEMNIDKDCSKYVSATINISFKNPIVELQVKAMDANDNVIDKKIYRGVELKDCKLQEVKGAKYYIFEKKNSYNKVEREIGDSAQILVSRENCEILKPVYVSTPEEE